ncbi:2'-5' RNA ligase family protein [Fulvimarina sp. MAC3]|uniref:2'-5' RNA ligase family protein n=1 Tax=Fulvimarina sp. MAC3 TaxID=3148887 RepID=UPI0031FD674B
MTDEAPLILTLRFDDESFERFQKLRQKHFPPSRNLIPAHLTLFHHLPGHELEMVTGHLEKTVAEWGPIKCRVSGLRFLGKGVAYEVDSPPAERLRADLAGHFYDHLTAQDRQRINPHVTIQNKAEASVARKLYEELESAFEPFSFEATGLLLWSYRGGPWEAAGEFQFCRKSPDVDQKLDA